MEKNNSILYKSYLEIKGKSVTTIKKYQGALRTIANELGCDISEITMDKFLANKVLVQKDLTGHNMYSVAVKHYEKSLNEWELQNINDNKPVFMINAEIHYSKKLRIEHLRSHYVKNLALKNTNYQCEIDNTHKTFTQEGSKNQYMEGHHIIYLNKQEFFDINLDDAANILVVCPNCHRKLHYSENSERKLMLEKIYDTRYEKLKNIGIKITKEDFCKLLLS